jgi:NAD(P)-dependent dehydrogenase (short-subunit alcohol dehydrogenase family)
MDCYWWTEILRQFKLIEREAQALARPVQIRYTPIGAYGQSKTADALLAVGINQRWADDGIRSNTLHAGAIATGHCGASRMPWLPPWGGFQCRSL